MLQAQFEVPSDSQFNHALVLTLKRPIDVVARLTVSELRGFRRHRGRSWLVDDEDIPLDRSLSEAIRIGEHRSLPQNRWSARERGPAWHSLCVPFAFCIVVNQSECLLAFVNHEVRIGKGGPANSRIDEGSGVKGGAVDQIVPKALAHEDRRPANGGFCLSFAVWLPLV